MTESRASKPVRVVTGVLLLMSSGLGGSSLGLLWVRLFVPRRAMGFDGIADVLGGLMFGGLLGLAAAAVAIVYLTPSTQRRMAAVMTVIIVLAFAVLVATAPAR